MPLQAVPGNNPVGRPESLADPSRDVVFKSLGSVGMGNESIFLLDWAGRSVGVSARGPLVDKAQGQERAVWVDLAVGQREIRFTGSNVEPYEFATPEEREEATLLATECLLVYGLFFNGLSLPSGYCTVALNGKQYVREDFGYDA